MTLGRRDFIKLATALTGAAALSSAAPLRQRPAADPAAPNIILILVDAMSARNLSLYGYARPTTPNFEKFAERANVYHAHHAAGNFTTAGTASMLTGLYPWTHRAINFRGLVKRSLEDVNMFALLGSEYHRLAYSQNPWASLLIGQMARNVDEFLPLSSFSTQRNVPVLEEHFPNDYAMGYMAFEDFLGANDFNPSPGSISLGFLELLLTHHRQIDAAPKYPQGLPSNFFTYFRIEELMSGLAGSLGGLNENRKPFFAYYHLFPPHAPYKPRRDFLELYRQDGFAPAPKPIHPLAEARHADDRLLRIRLAYDQYVTNLDHEFGLLVDGLERSGILENSILIVTSDHGETFERGENGHGSPLMYEPVTRIPLMIRQPAQGSRVDVHSVTSNIDLLPTLLSLTGRDIPPSLEGRILPALGGVHDPERGVFSVFAKESSAFLPLTKAVLTLNKSQHKLIYYRGYDSFDGHCEFYDLEADPEEMNDLSDSLPVAGATMQDELLSTLADADRPFQKQ